MDTLSSNLNNLKKLPVLLKSLRKERGLTQADVAAQMNLSPQRISAFEQVGTGEYPSLEQFIRFSHVFEIPDHELMARAVGEQITYPLEMTKWVASLRDVVAQARALCSAEITKGKQ